MADFSSTFSFTNFSPYIHLRKPFLPLLPLYIPHTICNRKIRRRNSLSIHLNVLPDRHSAVASASDFDLVSTTVCSDGSVVFSFGDKSEVTKNPVIEEPNIEKVDLTGEIRENSDIVEILNDDLERKVASIVDQDTDSEQELSETFVQVVQVLQVLKGGELSIAPLSSETDDKYSKERFDDFLLNDDNGHLEAVEDNNGSTVQSVVETPKNDDNDGIIQANSEIESHLSSVTDGEIQFTPLAESVEEVELVEGDSLVESLAKGNLVEEESLVESLDKDGPVKEEPWVDSLDKVKPVEEESLERADPVEEDSSVESLVKVKPVEEESPVESLERVDPVEKDSLVESLVKDNLVEEESPVESLDKDEPVKEESRVDYLDKVRPVEEESSESLEKVDAVEEESLVQPLKKDYSVTNESPVESLDKDDPVEESRVDSLDKVHPVIEEESSVESPKRVDPVEEESPVQSLEKDVSVEEESPVGFLEKDEPVKEESPVGFLEKDEPVKEESWVDSLDKVRPVEEESSVESLEKVDAVEEESLVQSSKKDYSVKNESPVESLDKDDPVEQESRIDSLDKVHPVIEEESSVESPKRVDLVEEESPVQSLEKDVSVEEESPVGFLEKDEPVGEESPESAQKMLGESTSSLIVEEERTKDEEERIDLPHESRNSEIIDLQLSESAVSRDEISTPKLFLSSGAYLSPHPCKALTGGEDAYFIANQNWLGVADGVGQWSLDGIDPGVYAGELMDLCKNLVLEKNNGVELAKPVLDILDESVVRAESLGSATVVISHFDGQILHAANVGDAGFMVIRNGSVYKKSSRMFHEFNFPIQIKKGEDVSQIAEEYRIDLDEGDFIVTATDGLFDNLYEKEITSIVTNSLENEISPQEIAEVLGRRAQEVGRSTHARSPFADAAHAAGYFSYTGGKLDDVAVIVSLVQTHAQ